MDKYTGKKSKANRGDKNAYSNTQEEFAKDNSFGNEKSNKSHKSNCK